MKSLYTKSVANLLFPLHEYLKGHNTVSIRKFYEKTQWWPAEKLKVFQLERLKGLLQQAHQNVPYYRKLIDDTGFRIDELHCLSDLQRLPFLTKAIIREYQEDLKSKTAQGLSKFSTGGSSGEPLIFYIGKERISHDVAAKWRATRWWDVDIGDKEIVVWGSPIELSAQDRVRLIRDKLLRTKLISAFEMSDEKLDYFIGEILKFRPKMLFGYPSALSLIANYAESSGRDMTGLKVKVAFVTSEKLYDYQREAIERIFNCRVANGYGGRDAGFIAHECPHGNMHITAEDIIVEVVDQHDNVVSDGESGEIVVTHMATGSFPFIRYRTGDMGVVGTEGCSCGRGLPLLKEIQGRTTDFIVAMNGTRMHGLVLIYVLREQNGIQEFKIIQDDITHTRVQLVTSDDYNDEQDSQIKEQFKNRLGDDVVIEIEKVSNIPAEKSGKFRYVISHARV